MSSSVKGTLIAVVAVSAVLLGAGLAHASHIWGIGPVDCNPKGEATEFNPATGTCYRLKASCKGNAQDEGCVKGAVTPPVSTFLGTIPGSASVISDCGGYSCTGLAVDPPDVKASSVKASCKWSGGASVKASLKEDLKLCVPCCLKPNKTTGCAGVCLE